MHAIRILSAAVPALLVATAPAHAQVSEARLKELIHQAADAANQPIVFSEPQNVNTSTTGPSVSLTLDEAVKLALDRNLDIRVQRLNPQLQDIR